MGRTIFLLITQVSVLLKLWNFQSLAISQRLEAYSAHYRRKRLVGHFVCLLRCVKEGKLKITVPSLLITFFCCFHCYLFYKKRDKGKQFIWTTQYVIVETLTNSSSYTDFLGSMRHSILTVTPTSTASSTTDERSKSRAKTCLVMHCKEEEDRPSPFTNIP